MAYNSGNLVQRKTREIERQRLSTSASLNRLIETKLVAIERLKFLSKISKNLGVRERRLTEGTIGNIELGTPSLPSQGIQLS
jgi:hypothetical protein